MSYGVSITYYKFPLQEALELSKKALWQEAKEAVWISQDDLGKEENIKTKNAICLNIQKHSGQSHKLILQKNGTLYEDFLTLLSQELSADEEIQLPHSLQHSIKRVESIINAISIEKIEPFFENMFNENIHRVKHKKALEALQNILRQLKDKESKEVIHLYKDCKIKEPVDVIFSMLSAIKLLRGDR
jgi:CRISPR-associated protein Cmr2